MKFTWNKKKAERVLAEHKIDFDKIKDVFDDPFAVDILMKAIRLMMKSGLQSSV